MFVLASASKARQKLLDQISLKHIAIVSDFDETKVKEFNPCLQVQLLAQGKAESVFYKIKKMNEPKNNFKALLACDSLFEFEGKVFGKPTDKEQLISRLKRMSGKIGFLHTGHYLIYISEFKKDLNSIFIEKSFEGVVSTKIEFMSLSTQDILNYASSAEPYHCAGGFAIEGNGGLFIKNIDGCFSNVIGLSLPWLKVNLAKCGLSNLLLKN
mgnify:CR=1 FL=1|tara:strand:- start:133 stop:768 length:636 start_codon:yes stop_codon:yes gene_type:complete